MFNLMASNYLVGGPEGPDRHQDEYSIKHKANTHPKKGLKLSRHESLENHKKKIKLPLQSRRAAENETAHWVAHRGHRNQHKELEAKLEKYASSDPENLANLGMCSFC